MLPSKGNITLYVFEGPDVYLVVKTFVIGWNCARDTHGVWTLFVLRCGVRVSLPRSPGHALLLLPTARRSSIIISATNKQENKPEYVSGRLFIGKKNHNGTQ